MWVVPADVVVMPCDELAANLGIEVAHEPGDHAILKIDGGGEAIVVAGDVAELVGRFRAPSTIEAAAGDADVADVTALVEALAEDGLIVDADAEERRVLALAGAGARLLDDTLARLAGDLPGAEPAGIALALGRIATLRRDDALATLARSWLGRAEDGRPAVGVPDLALVRVALGDAGAIRDFVGRDDAATLIACVGAGGELIARGEAIKDALVDLARRGSVTDGPPRSLGVAHGWAGMLYAILAWCAATNAPVPPAIVPRLDELAALAERFGRGARWPWRSDGPVHATLFRCTPGWCNGSAGFVHVWTLAHALLGRADFHALAEASAWNAWEERWTNGSVCCGLAGQAYALVRFGWHARGRALAELAATRMTGALCETSQLHRLDGVTRGSLYRGDVGVALLAAELAHGDARMPLFA